MGNAGGSPWVNGLKDRRDEDAVPNFAEHEYGAAARLSGRLSPEPPHRRTRPVRWWRDQAHMSKDCLMFGLNSDSTMIEMAVRKGTTAVFKALKYADRLAG